MNAKAQLYQINDFVQWYENSTLNLNAKYQRGMVWNEIAKSYFIDSIMKAFPVPPIFIRQTIDIQTRTTMREVIDGQQRLRAIMDFYKGKIAWKKAHSGRNRSLYFDDLNSDEQIAFLNYTLFVNIVSQEEDSKIFDMFTRLNSNSVVVNRQENRNAKYWGQFKLFINELGEKVRPFFMKNEIFKDSALVRMQDLEFLSGLTLVIINGNCSETQTLLDKLYEKYDKEFEQGDEYFEKIIFVIEKIERIFIQMGITESYFFNKTYVFTIFSVLYYNLYNIENLSINKNEALNLHNIDNSIYHIAEKMNVLNNDLTKIYMKLNEPLELDWSKEFERLHRTRTTSKEERALRIKMLNKYL